MFINPKIAIENEWVIGWDDIDWDKYIQPNALDFPINSVMRVNPETSALVTENSKLMRTLSNVELSKSHLTSETTWKLERSVTYDGSSDFYVSMPEGYAAYLITRSTFTRNGVFIQSGLYDSAFKGSIGFTIYPFGGSIELAPGTRIGQIVFVKSEASGIAYAGGYNHLPGSHWSDSK
jgi:deoxycytidine triphosphate deaminase